MALVDNVTVLLGIDVNSSQFRRAERALENINNQLESLTTTALAASAAFAGLIGLQTINDTELIKLATRYDTTAKSIEAVVKASEALGITIGEVESNFDAFTERVGELQDGGEGAIKMFAQLGISSNDFGEDAVGNLSTVIKNVQRLREEGLSGAQIRFRLAEIGLSELGQAIAANTDRFNNVTRFVQNISNITGYAVENQMAFNEAWSFTTTIFDSFIRVLGARTLPLFTGFINKIVENALGLKELNSELRITEEIWEGIISVGKLFFTTFAIAKIAGITLAVVRLVRALRGLTVITGIFTLLGSAPLLFIGALVLAVNQLHVTITRNIDSIKATIQSFMDFVKDNPIAQFLGFGQERTTGMAATMQEQQEGIQRVRDGAAFFTGGAGGSFAQAQQDAMNRRNQINNNTNTVTNNAPVNVNVTVNGNADTSEVKRAVEQAAQEFKTPIRQ